MRNRAWRRAERIAAVGTRVGRIDVAQDATQETFARAFEHWDRFDPSQPLGPWLHTIAARVSLDALRRQRVRSLLGMGRPAVPQAGGRAVSPSKAGE